MVDEAIKKRLKHREDMFLRRLFGVLAKMAKADGKIDAWEVHAAEGAFARFDRAAQRRKFCVGVFNAAKSGRTSIDRLAAEFATKWAAQEDCLALYELLWDVACAKGILVPSQKNILRRICASLNLPGGYYDIFYRRRSQTFRECEEEVKGGGRRRSSTRGGRSSGEKEQRGRGQGSAPPPRQKTPLEEAYEILGCSSSDSNEALRKAYRTAAKKNHPDMLRARGCTEAQARKATETMSRINSAWERIKSARGM